MGGINKKIVGAVAIIAGAGVLAAWSGKKPITRVILGSYVLMIVLSILDFFGGTVSALAGAIAMVAVAYVLLHEFPWQTLISAVSGSGQATGAKSNG